MSVVVGDFDDDSNADLAVSHALSSEVSILLGNGDGTFSGPTNFDVAGSGPSNGPQSIAVGNLDGDGDQDLAVINSSGGTVTDPSGDVSILLGNGDGTFSAGQNTVRAGTFPFALAVDDFNADTLQDLAAASFGSAENCAIPPAPACPVGVSILLGTGAGIFSPPASFDADDSSLSLAIDDFDADSDADIAVANNGSNNVSILLGNGDGTFTGPTNFAAGTGPWQIAVGDYNRDSKADLAVVGGQYLAILLGNGDGTFTAPSLLPAAGTSVAASDFDADNKLDLAVAANGVSLLLGRGDGSFTAPKSFPAGTNTHSIAVADFNGDSRPDVAVANYADPGTVSVLLNIPDGYARPKAATPSVVRLVPAYEECTVANASHGAPLSSPSCNPPRQSSDFLTVGTPDANGKAAASSGYIQLKVVGENPVDPDNGDQADVQITTSLTDVRNRSDLTDYTGELQAVLGLRITDRYNAPLLDDPATVMDSPLSFSVPCSATTGTEGGSCNLTTTADAVMSEVARERQRAIWELSQVKVYDGGSDGDADTAGDNTLFAVQGTFAP